jgi:uncharacterized membrane protein (UPF0127 family)
VTRRRAAFAVVAALVVVALVVVTVSRRGGGGDGALAGPIRAALDASRAADAPFAAWQETRLAVGTRCLRLVVAGSAAEREQGLRGITSLGPYDGMVFVMPGDSRTAWTMAGAPLPLDLGLYDRSGRPVERHELVPCAADFARCPLTRPERKYRLGVEAPRGSLPSGALTGCAA